MKKYENVRRLRARWYRRWMDPENGGKYEKYEGVWRMRTRCHGRWIIRARYEKREGGYSIPDDSSAED